MRLFLIPCLLAAIILVSSSQDIFAQQKETTTLDGDHRVSSDSTKDSLSVGFSDGKFRFRHRRENHNFIITEGPDERITRFIEPFSMMDFNRVTGFFLGIGSSRYLDLGRYEEIGIKAGIGYGFAKHKGQSFLGAEYRIPLQTLKLDTDSTLGRASFTSVPTLAFGGEYHNLTTTEDQWRIGRLENAFAAFFAREDFRDYFKIEGWEAHLAYRLTPHSEARFEYRNDVYSSEIQRVFYGRFGGNKRLPVNPSITEGRFQSFVLSYMTERSRIDFEEATTIFGDSVELETMKGTSYLVQAEFGNHLSDSKTFTKYTLDLRRFQPLVHGLNIDSRLRFESATGDVPIQKMQFLGGPSTLPAYKNKVFAGNRMVLFNTEVRLDLAVLLTLFEHSGTQLILKNDFGYITTDTTNSPIGGIGKSGGPNVLYNPGIGIGSVSGIELGVSWRTDIGVPPRFFFRFERPF